MQRGLDQRRLDGAGNDGIDADTFGRVFHRHATRERGDGAFGRKVGSIGTPASERKLRANQNDRTATTFPHRPNARTRPEKTARQVGLKNAFPLVQGRLHDALAGRPARTGQENVEAAKPLGDSGRVAFHGGFVPDIALEDKGLIFRIAQLARWQFTDIAVDDHDIGALSSKELGAGQANPRRPAGDDRDLARQSSAQLFGPPVLTILLACNTIVQLVPVLIEADRAMLVTPTSFAMADATGVRTPMQPLTNDLPDHTARLNGGGAPILSVRDLRVEFVLRRGLLTAIDGVSFDLAKGEVLGVVGESGAGKSVTGAAIIGLIDPPGRIAAGEVRLAGERIDTLSEDELRRIRGRRISMIFQDPLTSLNPLFTIGDQLVETIRAHLPMSLRQARERALELLIEVGIPAAQERIGAYPHEFSGGMRQRVVIALALCAEPDIVVADEPTTALDVSVQAQIITLIKRLCRERGTAVMLITHDMGVIAETADRVAVMYAGRIVEIGPVAAIINEPLHPYSVGLMGAIPSLEQETSRLAQIPGTMPRLSEIPRGCAFHPRCSRAFDRCTTDRPPSIAVSGRRVACHLYEGESETTQ